MEKRIWKLKDLMNHPLLKNYNGENQLTIAQDKLFNTILKAVSNKYHVKRGEDKVYVIPCRLGDIAPYSFTELCCYQEFRSSKEKSFFKKKLPVSCTVTQEGDEELIFKFFMEHLDQITALVGAKKRRVLTEDEKSALTARLHF
jgi:hypothetical protein